MARANSWNVELDNEGYIHHPVTFAEFSPGEEGTIDVADGQRKFKVRDQIFQSDEVEMSIYLKADKKDYDNMESWVKSARARDVFINLVDSARNVKISFLFKNCDCTRGKKSAFDRNSKSADMVTYKLLPEDITEIK